VHECDIVVSMVPPMFHHIALKACIAKRKNMVTASYVSADMKALEVEVNQAGIAVMNEIGLDPGIDHMTVMKVVKDVQKKGGRILSFRSVCGAIPTPAAANNPLKYKLSWSPIGSLRVQIRPAKYLENGQILEIQGKDLMKNVKDYPKQFLLPLEYFPNGDSISYVDKYELHGVPSVMRGTLRYKGFSSFVIALVEIGIYDDRPQEINPQLTWLEVMEQLCESSEPLPDRVPDSIPAELHPVCAKIAGKLSSYSLSYLHEILSGIVSLGLLDRSHIGSHPSLLVALASKLTEPLTYQAAEKDLVIMEHYFEIEEPGRRYRLTSTLVDEGLVSDCSATAKLVGLPVAIAAQYFLTYPEKQRGLLYPIHEEFYEPVLQELKHQGVSLHEHEEDF
jgi:saccharopine dehydrogenase-like NADP-dependent oxidoreductase